jgi:VWFA-related protein
VQTRDYRISAGATKIAIVLVMAACVWPLGIFAQQAFRSSTELVSVDVIATDESGRPVANLSAADFLLKVDGKVRPITSVQLVQVTSPDRTRPNASPAAPALPAPFATNTEAKGRAFIFVIDHEHIHAGNEKLATDAAGRLVDRLTPEDRAAVVTLPRGHVDADLSTDRAQTRAALAGIMGHAPRKSSRFEFSIKEANAVLARGNSPGGKDVISEMVSRECEHETLEVCRPALISDARSYALETETAARDTVRGLRALLTGLSALDGTKSVIFISEALIETPDIARDMEELGQAADLARVRMFVIQVQRPSSDASRRRQPADELDDLALELAGLENAAGVTGGEMFRPSGRVDEVMTTIDSATSAYYLLGFEPAEKERDGKYHKIQLTLNRPSGSAQGGVRIKSRNGFQITAHTDATATGVDTSPLAGMLRDNIRAFRDLPLRATAFAYRADDPAQIKIVIMAESLGATPVTSAAFAVISESGGQGAEWVADPKELAASPVVTAGAVLPGRYRVRVAASDATGRRGVVDVGLDAQLTDGTPVKLSALMAGRLTNGVFEPRFEFAGAREITGFLEMYDVPLLGAAPSVTLELASDANGPALASAQMTIATTAAPDRRLARGTVSIPADAPAGDLILRAKVSLAGQPAGVVSRTIRR